MKEDKSENKINKKKFQKITAVNLFGKTYYNIYEISKNATKSVNKNIKGLFEHSGYGPNYLEWKQ